PQPAFQNNNLERFNYFLKIRERLAHPHEYNVRYPPPFFLFQESRDLKCLIDDFVGFEVSHEPTSAGQAETTCLLTAHLGRYAERLAFLIRNQDAFDRVTILKLKEELSRTVRRDFRPGDFWLGNRKE